MSSFIRRRRSLAFRVSSLTFPSSFIAFAIVDSFSWTRLRKRVLSFRAPLAPFSMDSWFCRCSAISVSILRIVFVCWRVSFNTAAISSWMAWRSCSRSTVLLLPLRDFRFRGSSQRASARFRRLPGGRCCIHELLQLRNFCAGSCAWSNLCVVSGKIALVVGTRPVGSPLGPRRRNWIRVIVFLLRNRCGAASVFCHDLLNAFHLVR
ncbi:hypothetical protein BJ741DRAFT_366515 [Chytriomyces cf. hyalinus JEL632]|nr:hypothetical protein BJ741DRAFT_366515 [Chytriomyces cf. hyalinus JEL632]